MDTIGQAAGIDRPSYDGAEVAVGPHECRHHAHRDAAPRRRHRRYLRVEEVLAALYVGLLVADGRVYRKAVLANLLSLRIRNIVEVDVVRALGRQRVRLEVRAGAVAHVAARVLRPDAREVQSVAVEVDVLFYQALRKLVEAAVGGVQLSCQK